VTSTSGAEVEDQAREAWSYNFTIYLMLGVLFGSIGGFVFVVARAMRRKARADELLLQDTLSRTSHPSVLPGGSPCPPPSVGDVS
jgi:hypothetical protein